MTAAFLIGFGASSTGYSSSDGSGWTTSADGIDLVGGNSTAPSSSSEFFLTSEAVSGADSSAGTSTGSEAGCSGAGSESWSIGARSSSFFETKEEAFTFFKYLDHYSLACFMLYLYKKDVYHYVLDICLIIQYLCHKIIHEGKLYKYFYFE